MHFNFHLSGYESPEQSRRIANAVLALGGLPHTCDGAFLATGVVNHVEAPTLSGEERAFLDEIMDRSEAQFGAGASDAPLTESVSALVELAGATYAPEVPPVPTTPGVETKTPLTDHNGLPWDERIHSSSRAINADGTWRYRKNVPDETKRDVEAELRGAVTVGQTVTAPEVPSLNADLSNIVDYAGAKSIPVPPTPPAPPAPPVPTGALQRTYSDVVNLIMARKVQPDTYVAILGMSLPEFAKHVISAPNDATLMFDALDQASRT